MSGLFSALLQQSLTACWMIPPVLALRFALKKAPRHITNLLWLVVAFRLVCPVSFESDLSLLTQTKNAVNLVAELSVSQRNQSVLPSEPLPSSEKDVNFTPVIPQEVSPSIIQSEQIFPSPVPPSETPEAVIPPEGAAAEQILPNRTQLLRIGCGLWLGGMAFMMLNGLLSTRRWRERVRTAVRDGKNIWRSEAVDTPFILGVLRPKIYLPFVLPQGAEHHVIAHEQAHLRRRDPLMKFLAFVLLSVYWFHPLVWISYLLFCRDMELACDQLVTRNLDAEGKKAYSAALLACTVSQGDPLLCPLSFGEVGVKARIKSVLQKKPGKLLSFTALMLCTVLIIVCAADPKGTYSWKTAYQQELEQLLIQYGANANYGLQSLNVVDLWQDGTPELVLVRRLDETEHGPPSTVLMVFEYANGEVQHRMTRHFDPGADLRWMRCDQGIRFLALLPSAAHPIVQTMETVTITGEMDGGSYLSVEIPSYVQLDDGRWIEKRDRINKDSRYLTDQENAALLKDAKSLMNQDWRGFLKKNTGVLSYQRAYLDRITQLENRRQRATRYSNLVDFNSDGYPELVTTCGDKLYVYRYNPEKGIADTVWTEELGCPYGEEDKRVFGINLTLERPALIVYFEPYPQSEFIEIYQWEEGDPIRRFPKLTLQARGDESGRRDRMHDWVSWYDDLTQAQYEELRMQYLEDAVLFDTSYHSPSISDNSYTNAHDLHLCEMPLLADQEPVKAVETPAVYTEILTQLIAQYGFFDAGDGTLPVLGLKYAGLYNLGGDETPELVTLVNTKDEDNALHMTLRVYSAESGISTPTYQTELGARYLQTDVSYSFAVSDYRLMTYHSASEWTEEVVHVIEDLHETNPDVQVYRALFPEDADTSPRFWLNEQEVSVGEYSVLDRFKNNAVEFDACWDVSPAGRAELTYFLNNMGVTPHGVSHSASPQVTLPDGSVAYGELTYRGKTYGLPQYDALSSGDSTVEQVGKHLLITTHANPDHNVYDVFNTETLNFEQSFWGLVLGWREEDISTLVYCQWNELYTYDGLSLGQFAQEVDPNVLLVEGGRYSPDGETFTVAYCDDTLSPKEESFPVPERAVLEAANLLNGRGIWRTGLLFCPTFNGLTNTEAQTLAAELLRLYGPVAQWPFESCQVSRTKSGSVKLSLLQPHDESKLCLDYTFYLEPDGTILRAEDGISDGYSGTLVYEDDNCTIIASRRAESCLRGGDPCGYCYVTDLTLWNADRTKGTLLLEGAELGTNFTVLDGPEKTGVLSIAYHTGLSHSDSTTMVFGNIDLSAATYTETAREVMPI